tara:strand:+ start:17734 stop:18201 length:468 start_codon:yes stop_codon:yes gene_type:complete
MRLLIVAIVSLFVLSGCGRYNVKPPEADFVSQIEPLEVPQIEVQDVPESPTAHRITADGQSWAAFDKQGMDALLEMRAVAHTNTQALREMVKANASLIEEREQILRLAYELEEEINRIGGEWAQAENDKRKAEDLRSMERALSTILLLLGAAVAL